MRMKEEIEVMLWCFIKLDSGYVVDCGFLRCVIYFFYVK